MKLTVHPHLAYKRGKSCVELYLNSPQSFTAHTGTALLSTSLHGVRSQNAILIVTTVRPHNSKTTINHCTLLVLFHYDEVNNACNTNKHTTLCAKHLFNYTNQNYNIYSFHTFTTFLLHVSVLPTYTIMCALLNTACCFTAINYGYYNSYVTNIKNTTCIY